MLVHASFGISVLNDRGLYECSSLPIYTCVCVCVCVCVYVPVCM
jgi:hypothetical protein